MPARTKSNAPSSKLAAGLYHVVYTAGGMGMGHWLAYHELDADQAARLYSQLKRQGRTVWVETAEGVHVPMKGTMRPMRPLYASWSRCVVR